MLNGASKGKFEASRGLRQGDPLSPLLFSLSVDVLGRLLKRAANMGVIEGVSIGKEKINLTHLQFADDTILFSNGDESKFLNFLKIVKIFELFCAENKPKEI